MGIFDLVGDVFNLFFGGEKASTQIPDPEPKSLWENPLFLIILVFGFITVIALVFRK